MDARFILLLPIAFGAGIITAVSPCVFPVLPILFAGGAADRNPRRPYAIIAGLVLCFLVSILFATWILDQLGLPQDLLRDISIGLLFLVAAMTNRSAIETLRSRSSGSPSLWRM